MAPEEKTPFVALIEGLAKVFAVALALATALGLPAVAIQMWRLAIPWPVGGAIPDIFVSSLERGMALRAGVVPSIALALLAWGIRELWNYNKQAETVDKNEAEMAVGPLPLTTVGLAVLMATLISLGLLIAAAIHIVARVITIYFWKDQVVYLAVVEITVLLLSVILLRIVDLATDGGTTRVLLRPLQKIVEKGNQWEKKRKTRPVLIFSVAISVAIFLLATLPGWVDEHVWNRESGHLGHQWILFLGVGVGCVAGAMVIFLAGVMQSVSDTASLPWYRKSLWTASVVYFYLPFALVWSVKLFPVVPYEWGGGKPTACTLWVDHKKFPEDDLRVRLPGIKQFDDHDSTRLENAFLIYLGSDAVILADSDDPFAQAIFLPRDSIQAIAHKR